MLVAEEQIEELAMPFSAENQKLITDEIAAAIKVALKDIKPPSGFRKALFVLREWGVLGANFTVIVTLAIFAATQWNAANKRLTDDGVQHTNTDNRLKAIEARLIDLRALIASSQPARKQNQDAAKEILAEAQHKVIPPLPISVVEQSGRSFLSIAEKEPRAWEVALKFASYRSTLNASYRPSEPTVDVPQVELTHYSWPTPEGKESPSLSNTPDHRLPINEAARLAPIGVDLNRNVKTGPAWIFVTGGAVSLDLMHARRAVFQNVEVHYSGTSLVLEGVLFINCTFVFDNTDRGRQLGEVLLASARVSFGL